MLNRATSICVGIVTVLVLGSVAVATSSLIEFPPTFPFPFQASRRHTVSDGGAKHHQQRSAVVHPVAEQQGVGQTQRGTGQGEGAQLNTLSTGVVGRERERVVKAKMKAKGVNGIR